jgi:hypothetical protein
MKKSKQLQNNVSNRDVLIIQKQPSTNQILNAEQLRKTSKNNENNAYKFNK